MNEKRRRAKARLACNRHKRRRPTTNRQLTTNQQRQPTTILTTAGILRGLLAEATANLQRQGA